MISPEVENHGAISVEIENGGLERAHTRNEMRIEPIA
jgi:hypothetical protein